MSSTVCSALRNRLPPLSRAFVSACVLAALLAAPAHADDGPAIGTMIGPDTWQQARGLLPDEFLKRYETGEFRHPVGAVKPGIKLMAQDWLAAGKDNEGKFLIDDGGSIVEKSTGKQPKSIWGVPFPTIDAKDPNAAVKIIWNFFYQSYLLGDNRNLVTLSWVARNGTIDRQFSTDVLQKFWDGLRPREMPAENPMNLVFQQLVRVTYPKDIEGTVSLSWRYRDTRRDSSWAYVPALRRVRQVSPTNRSDGFLGSDMSPDDGSYFDGKPEDFEWTLTGEGEELFLLDKAAVVDGTDIVQPIPGGGWREVRPPGPRFAYQLDEAQRDKALIPWAPVPDRYVLVRRPVWLLEARPKDKYYLYGKILLRIDKENWYGCYSSKYDWQGQLLNSYMPMHGAWFPKDDLWVGSSPAGFQLSQNFKLDRATAGQAYGKGGDPTIPSDTHIQIPLDTFDVNSLSKSGR